MKSKAAESAIKPDDKWQVEDDARTLMRAEEIKQDKERFEKAMKHLSGQKKAIDSLSDLRKLSGGEDDE